MLLALAHTHTHSHKTGSQSVVSTLERLPNFTPCAQNSLLCDKKRRAELRMRLVAAGLLSEKVGQFGRLQTHTRQRAARKEKGGKKSKVAQGEVWYE
jgi:hypothetical protein